MRRWPAMLASNVCLIFFHNAPLLLKNENAIKLRAAFLIPDTILATITGIKPRGQQLYEWLFESVKNFIVNVTGTRFKAALPAVTRGPEYDCDPAERSFCLTAREMIGYVNGLS